MPVTTGFDVERARRRFTTVGTMAFFDAPGGTQVPDEVADAMARYVKESSANVGAPYATSRRTEAVVERARRLAAGFLGCRADEVIFGANATSLLFTLSRTAGRSLRPGDEIIVTKLDHDANVASWLELARDLGLHVRHVPLIDDCRLDLQALERLLNERTRIVAFPWASNAVGTITPAREICALAHAAGATAWVDAVQYAPHQPMDVAETGADVLVCSAYKFFGPHLGIAYGRAELLDSWRPYKVRPAPDVPLGHRFETGTPPYELLAGLIAALEYLTDTGGVAAHAAWEQKLGSRFLAELPPWVHRYGPRDMTDRVPTFAFNLPERAPDAVAVELARRGVAVWGGNYYALGVMEHLGVLATLRAGLAHYNDDADLDRLLAGIAALR